MAPFPEPQKFPLSLSLSKFLRLQFLLYPKLVEYYLNNIAAQLSIVKVKN